MPRVHPILAIIPARGGSKGLPDKNIRPLAGIPLIAHTILLARSCPEVKVCVVSTDSSQIAAVAREYGGEVPFLRPPELAQDDTPIWPVLQHAMREMERRLDLRFGSLLLLQPTSPGRLPEDVARGVAMLDQDANAVGVIAVSEPSFNPRAVCVEQASGYMRFLFPASARMTRRQDVPVSYRINGLLYLWRRDHLLASDGPRVDEKPHSMLLVPDERAIDIDHAADLELAELLARSGRLRLPAMNLKP